MATAHTRATASESTKVPYVLLHSSHSKAPHPPHPTHPTHPTHPIQYGTLPVTRTNAAAAAASSLHPRPSSNTSSSSCHPLLLPLLLVLLLGSANALIYKTMFATYGESGAFFVSTGSSLCPRGVSGFPPTHPPQPTHPPTSPTSPGVNFLYILYGGLLLYPRMCLTDAVTPAMKALPKRRFLVMGFLVRMFPPCPPPPTYLPTYSTHPTYLPYPTLPYLPHPTHPPTQTNKHRTAAAPSWPPWALSTPPGASKPSSTKPSSPSPCSSPTSASR